MSLLMRGLAGRLVLFAGVSCGLLVGVGASAQEKAGAAKMTLVEPPTPLLPLRLATWTLADAVATQGSDAKGASFSGTTCAPLPLTSAPENAAGEDGARCATILAEDGLLRLAAGTYQHDGVEHNGAAGQAAVWAEQFGDATGAYSAYTFYRARMSGARVVNGTRVSAKVQALAENSVGGTQSVSDGSDTLVWAGTSLLRVGGHALSRSEIAALVTGLPKVSGRKGLSPLLPKFLPDAGLDPMSVRYALGPVGYQAMGGVLPGGMLGWDKSAETATAAYRGRGSAGTLTLLLYPTPQIAGDRGRVIEQAVNGQAGIDGAGSGQAEGVQAGGGQAGGVQALGTVRMRRIGPLIGVTSGGLSAEQAEGLIAALHLSQEVTFDKKMPLEFHAEIKKTASLLENIAVLCGVLVLAAVLLGLFLGGARAGIRVLQGKSAASEPEFLTINLRDRPNGLFLRENPEEDRSS